MVVLNIRPFLNSTFYFLFMAVYLDKTLKMERFLITIPFNIFTVLKLTPVLTEGLR